MSGLRDASSLIAPGEPPAFSVVRSGTARRDGREIVLVCGHASNRVPAALDGLGLGERHLPDHIAWDIGAAAAPVKLT